MLKVGFFISLILAVAIFPSLIEAACDMLKCRPVTVSSADKDAYCPALQKRIDCLGSFETNSHCAVNQKMEKTAEKMSSTSEYSFVCEGNNMGSNQQQGNSNPKGGKSNTMGDGMGGFADLLANFGKGSNSQQGGGHSMKECTSYKDCKHPEPKEKTSKYCSAILKQAGCLTSSMMGCMPSKEMRDYMMEVEANYNKYTCGVAGLSASALVCLLVCLVSMVFKW